MASSMSTDKEARRNTCTYSFFREALTPIEELVSLVVGGKEKTFSDQYGNLLTVVKTSYEIPALQTLLQFYDPELRCSTFQDYQLAPTL